MTNKYKMLRVCATDLFAKTALLPEIDFLQKYGWSIEQAIGASPQPENNRGRDA